MMRRLGALVFPLALLVTASAAPAQPGRELRGQVFHLGENGEKVYESGLVVKWLETGSSRETNDQGLFRLPLPPAFRPGAKVTLSIDKPKWRIRYPLDGETLVPASPDDTIKVELLPAGSRLFWTNDRIEKFIQDTAERAKRDAQPKPRESGATASQGLDFGRYIKEWAVRYGFTPQDVQKEIDRWIAETEANQDDVYKLGLAAFAKKQFADAARHFHESADWDARQIEEIDKRQEALAARRGQLRGKQVHALRLEGDSYLQTSAYAKALSAYEEAHGHTSQVETAELWAATLNDMSRAHRYLGIEGSSAESAAHLEQAVQTCRQALLVYTREQFPQNWAGIQNNLGMALQAQGTRTDGQHGAQLLAAAVEAYSQALLVYTREQLPQQWAVTQNNLGNSLQEQGTQTDGLRGAQLLAAAVEAYRRALLVQAQEQLPQGWATTQNNLGSVLQEQGTRTDGLRGTQLLAVAVEVYRKALLVYTREQLPQDWAMTQNNLGSVLQEQGTRTDGPRGTQLLADAVEAYSQALLVRTREQLPQDWAMTQNNLGSVLQEQGTRTDGPRGAQLVAGAVEAFRKALLVYTREQLPQQWATTQNNLGAALQRQSMRTEGEHASQLSAEAVIAFKQALEVFTYEQFPRKWNGTRHNEVQALLLADRYQEAATGLSDILNRNPTDVAAFQGLVIVLNDHLFDHHRALTTIQQWLANNPKEPSTRFLEVGALFASGDFAGCRAKTASLLATSGLPVNHKVVLLGYEAAVEMATGAAEGAATLASLAKEVTDQPSDFSTGLAFPGTLHSLQEHPEIPHRDLLVQLFKTLEAKDRDSITQGLRELQAELVTPSP
jgi:tetratricopeptide (TPR) repeat protein